MMGWIIAAAVAVFAVIAIALVLIRRSGVLGGSIATIDTIVGENVSLQRLLIISPAVDRYVLKVSCGPRADFLMMIYSSRAKTCESLLSRASERSVKRIDVSYII